MRSKQLDSTKEGNMTFAMNTVTNGDSHWHVSTKSGGMHFNCGIFARKIAHLHSGIMWVKQ